MRATNQLIVTSGQLGHLLRVKLCQGLQKASAPADTGQKLRYEQANINKIQTMEIVILRNDKKHSLSK
jgi:hypothetical protein